MTKRFLVGFTDGGMAEYTAADEEHARDLARHQYSHRTIDTVQELADQPRHPEVEVETKHLAKYPITATSAALRIGGVSLEEIKEFGREAEATIAGYPDATLDVIRKWVTVK